jgi:hypothetical protein
MREKSKRLPDKSESSRDADHMAFDILANETMYTLVLITPIESQMNAMPYW